MNIFVQKCKQFIQEQFQQRGFQKAILGLSGGIDSAVVAYLATLALGRDNVRVLLMPSLTSHQLHFNDALELTEILQIPSTIIKIAPFQESFAKQEGIDIAQIYANMLSAEQKLRMGNFCSRMRMILLYDYASIDRALVIGTSNKSEILLGYGTIFGDLACAINPIGSLYKTQIFTLAHTLDIPEHIIHKKPSADLFLNQSDEADLGYSYELIDKFLHSFIKLGGLEINKQESKFFKESLKKEGFGDDMIDRLCARVWANAFKRTMPTIFDYNE